MGGCISRTTTEAVFRSKPPEEYHQRLLGEDPDFFAVENCIDDSKFEIARKIPKILTSPWTLSNTSWQGTARPFCPYKNHSMVSEWIDLRLSFEYVGDYVHFEGQGEMTWGNEDIPPKKNEDNKKYRAKTKLRHNIHFEIKFGRLSRNEKTNKIDVEFEKEYKYVRQREQKLVEEQQKNVTKLYQEAHKDFFKLKYDSRQHPESLVTYRTKYFGSFKIGLKKYEMEGMYKIHSKFKKGLIDCGIFSMNAPSLPITKAINDIKSWDVSIIMRNRELANSYSVKALKVKDAGDAGDNEWVTKVKDNQKDVEGHTKCTVDGVKVVVTKRLGIENLILKNDNNGLEIGLAECGEITQNPWFDESMTSTWKENEDVALDLFGHEWVGYYHWVYNEPKLDDCKDSNMGGYNTVRIILYRQGKYQHRVELTGSVLPEAWFLALDKSSRRKIEYAAKNDFDKLRVCIEDRLGVSAYLTDNCGLKTGGKATEIVEYFNHPENKRDKRPMQWVHWGDIRVIPYVALGSLDESKCYEDEQPFDPEWYTSLSKFKRNEIRRKVRKKMPLTEKDDHLTQKEIRAVTAYHKRQLNYSDAPFEEKWWLNTEDELKEIMVSKVVEICREITQLKTNCQDEKNSLDIESLAKDKRLGLLKKLQPSYGVSEEQLVELYEYCIKKVRQMTTKKWYYMEKQLHDVEDWCNYNRDKNNVVKKRYNELNDMGPFPWEVFKTLKEWAVFTFGAKIINRGQDDDAEGCIGLVILMLVADSEWELRCIASLFEFARILTPDGLAKVDDSFSKFEVELAKEEKLKGHGATGHTHRASSLFHRSTRAVFKRVSTGKYLQNDVPLTKAR